MIVKSTRARFDGALIQTEVSLKTLAVVVDP